MKNLSILIFSFLLLLSSCKKEIKPYSPIERCADFTRNLDTIVKYIHGTWEWKEEKRFDRYQNGYLYFTPNSPGWHKLTVKLSRDTASFFVNSNADSVYKFKIQRWFEITGFPSDSLPVIAYYSFSTGIRKNAIPIMICKSQLLMQHQFVSSNFGEDIWLRK